MLGLISVKSGLSFLIRYSSGLKKHYKCRAHISKGEDDQSHKKNKPDQVEYSMLKNVFHMAKEAQRCKEIMNPILPNYELLNNALQSGNIYHFFNIKVSEIVSAKSL